MCVPNGAACDHVALSCVAAAARSRVCACVMSLYAVMAVETATAESVACFKLSATST